MRFQSTPSTQRETDNVVNLFGWIKFQSTPSTQRETWGKRRSDSLKAISIHSLYAEGDNDAHTLPASRRNFNPLPLRRGRPSSSNFSRSFFNISIHSLYAEGDLPYCRYRPHLYHFNPLPLRRGRRPMYTCF